MVSAAAATGALALPARLAAQPAPDLRTRAILDLAREQMQRHEAVLWRRDIVGIADFAAHSALPRFHFANLENGSVQSFRVAHGAGSDPQHDGWLKTFSNEHGSLATSRGAYVSQEFYNGKYGLSTRLGGLEADNSQAYDRAIVVHSADYCSQAHVDRWGRLGRSNGCLAFSPDDFYHVLTYLAENRLLYADRIGFI